jgi:D-2-hydroxyacid dehydrogenase (NADP+)
LVDARLLAAMKRSAYLVNIARGRVIDEPALIQALSEHRIAGAGLDVFATEPLPAVSPLWAMENVLLTPHIGGFFDGYVAKATPLWRHNLAAFATGDHAAMRHRVA